MPIHSRSFQAFTISGIPEVHPGDSLIQHVTTALEQAGERLHDGDIVVIAQKIVSKAEGRYLDISDVHPVL
ncbi:MAG: coenzyme F420-0:L-glutamate ligase [Rhodospirillales bacterium]